MSYETPNDPTPDTLTPAEKLVLRAMLTTKYTVSFNKPDTVTRPMENTLRYTIEGGVREGSFRRFCYHEPNVLEWALMMANSLSEERVPLMTSRANPNSLQASLDEARRVFESTFEAACAELQEELDESPESFAEWHKDAVVLNGKVVDPWGPALSGPTRWWFDNLTVTMTWIVYRVLENIAQEATQDNLAAWALSDGDDPRKAVREKFEKGLYQLFKDIEEALKSQGSTAAA
jgi:hypothetical protein